MPANHAAWEVYTRCWNQVISVGLGEILGLSIPALYLVMHSLGVRGDDEIEVLDKVLICYDRITAAKKTKGEGTDGQQRAPATGN